MIREVYTEVKKRMLAMGDRSFGFFQYYPKIDLLGEGNFTGILLGTYTNNAIQAGRGEWYHCFCYFCSFPIFLNDSAVYFYCPLLSKKRG